MNDIMHYLAHRATILYGGPADGKFTAACFCQATADVSGVKCILDGMVVRVLLTGRPDIEVLGNGYYVLTTAKL